MRRILVLTIHSPVERFRSKWPTYSSTYRSSDQTSLVWLISNDAEMATRGQHTRWPTEIILYSFPEGTLGIYHSLLLNWYETFSALAMRLDTESSEECKGILWLESRMAYEWKALSTTSVRLLQKYLYFPSRLWRVILPCVINRSVCHVSHDIICTYWAIPLNI